MSIYDEIGGHAAVKAAVEVFYQRVTADPLLKPWFEDVDLQRLKAHQRAFLAAALGGPEMFAGRDLGAAHATLNISGPAFDAVCEHLAITLRDLGVDAAAIDQVTARITPYKDVIVVAETVE
jgi:hemoglobin